jgi:hypothetical protein
LKTLVEPTGDREYQEIVENIPTPMERSTSAAAGVFATTPISD